MRLMHCHKNYSTIINHRLSGEKCAFLLERFHGTFISITFYTPHQSFSLSLFVFLACAWWALIKNNNCVCLSDMFGRTAKLVWTGTTVVAVGPPLHQPSNLKCLLDGAYLAHRLSSLSITSHHRNYSLFRRSESKPTAEASQEDDDGVKSGQGQGHGMF
jgi:hypothetical protein